MPSARQTCHGRLSGERARRPQPTPAEAAKQEGGRWSVRVRGGAVGDGQNGRAGRQVGRRMGR
eukprot:359399-Chlamydomonas_euryale.AAC.2